MTEKQFDAFCGSLLATTFVVQWSNSRVWKVGGKVFAIGRWDTGHPAISFKVSPLAFEILKEQPGLRPAPYLASRGLKWIQHFAKPGLDPAALKDYLRQSHGLAAQGLSKKRQTELGLLNPPRRD
jgi:predicted DNA-binding protein (MmcQ/YjbR family)